MIVFALSLKGTLPFMAVRLLRAWRDVEDGDRQFTHMAVADLESFLWILFWVPLELQHIKFKENRYPDSSWRRYLNSTDINMQVAKGHLVQELTVAMKTRKALGYIKLFHGLIQQWFAIACDGWIEVELGLLGDQAQLNLAFHQKYYERYLGAGFKYLGSLPDNWDVEEPDNK